MRFSSHRYLRTDGTLGKWPVIEVDDSTGFITNITEHEGSVPEQGHTWFGAGIIVPGETFNIKSDAFEIDCFSNNELGLCSELIRRLDNAKGIKIGEKAWLCIIENINLHTYTNSDKLRVRTIINRQY